MSESSNLGTDRVLFADSTIGDVVPEFYDLRPTPQAVVMRADGSASVQFDLFRRRLRRVLRRCDPDQTGGALIGLSSSGLTPPKRSSPISSTTMSSVSKATTNSTAPTATIPITRVRGDGNDTIFDYGSNDRRRHAVTRRHPADAGQVRVCRRRTLSTARSTTQVIIQPYQATDTFETITIAGQRMKAPPTLATVSSASSSRRRDCVGSGPDRRHGGAEGTGDDDFLQGTVYGETIVGGLETT